MPAKPVVALLPLALYGGCHNPPAAGPELPVDLAAPPETFLSEPVTGTWPQATAGFGVDAALADPSRWSAVYLSVWRGFVTDVNPPGAGRQRLVVSWTAAEASARSAEVHRQGGLQFDLRRDIPVGDSRGQLAEQCRALRTAGWGEAFEVPVLGEEHALRGSHLRLHLVIVSAARVARLEVELPFGAAETRELEGRAEAVERILGAWVQRLRDSG